ncbi:MULTISPECIES: transcription antitermination factor NusB [unclassified Dietzia]|uniref:transcription antitermination factor NusB n=1 Tax=unclassified Dietzia TaxID=2617939 RepID=UPI000D21FAC5|nr:MULTISPECIES: transcription antitermination factor NusB [unclassified Dietzia]AVZ39494.1 transcription antitermination factor NusB [Dietzia sp. JS16-p6b]QGW24777.1 transcription antitermination protein NusB [Dietzia sp. DQ12-45-1b]
MADEADHRRRGSRFRARKRAVALLFEAELRDADVVALAEERRRMGEESQEFHDVASYTMEIVTGVAQRLDRIDSMISEHLRDWTLERLPAVDRAVLRAGAWELLFGTEDVDAAIVIDQSVLLISDLSAEKSVPYVNAVLDRVAGLAEHIRAAERAVSSLDPAPTADVSEPTPDPPGPGAGD